MKISYRTHPILEKIANRKLGAVQMLSPSEWEFMKATADYFKEKFFNFTSEPFKTYYISDPFLEAYNIASKRLMHSKLWADIPNGNYCFLTSANLGFCLKVINEPQHGIATCEVIEMKESILLNFGSIQLVYDIDNDDDGRVRYTPFQGFKSDEIAKRGQDIMDVIGHYMIMILFIKYAQVDTKVLEPNKKVKDINCTYLNETPIKVTHLTSTWFTNLVRSEGFKVRGHFRLQPKKKDGEWTKELIWINDFEKHGYTRKAGILNQQP